MEESSQFKIFAGSKGEALAKRVCDEIGCQLGKLRIDRFSDVADSPFIWCNPLARQVTI